MAETATFDPKAFLNEGTDSFDPKAFIGGTASSQSDGKLAAISHPVQAAMQQIGSQESLQPYQSATEPLTSLFPKADGNPLSQAVNSVKALLELPTRFSQTLGKASEPVTDKTVEYLGMKGVPGPLAAALGMVAGAVSDPRNFVMGGKDLEPSPLKVGNVGGPATEQTVDQFGKYGMQATPAQASGNKLLGYAEAFLNRYPYSSDKFNDFYTKQLSDADNIRSSLLSKVGDNTATKTVSDMMKKQISEYLKTASPEDAAVLQDKFGDLESYMKKPVAGQFGQGMLAQASKIARDKADVMYSDLRNVVQDNAPISTPSFMAQAKKFLADEMQANPVDRDAGWIKRLEAYATPNQTPIGLETITPELLKQSGKSVDELLKGLGSGSSEIPFGGTQMTMKNLRDLRIQNDPGYLLGVAGQGNRFAGYAAKLRQSLAEDINAGVDSLSSQAKKALDESPHIDPTINSQLERMSKASDMLKDANKNYAQFKETFNDPFIKNLLKNDPEKFIDHAVTPSDISNVAKLKDALGEDNFLPVKQNLLANMMVNKTGDLSPTSFLNKVDKIGFPTLSKVFDPSELAEIVSAQKVFRHMTTMEKQVGVGSPTAGLMMAKGALYAAPSAALTALLGGIFTGNPVAGIATAAGTMTTALLPKVIASAYLSEPIRDMLIHGIVAPESATSVLGLMGKGAMMSVNSSVSQHQNANRQ